MITVKILCDCGTKFAFEADETLTLAAGVISCPNCGAEAATQANAQLTAARAQFETSPPPVQPTARPMRVVLQKPVAAAPEEPADAPPVETGETSAAPAARGPFTQRRPPSKAEQQIRRNQEAAQRRKPYVFAALIIGLALTGFWGWYRFVGSRPKPILNVQYERAERPLVPRLLAGDQLFLIRNRHLSLTDLRSGELLWEKSFGSVTNFDDGMPLFSEMNPRVARPTPEVRVTSNSFWIVWPDHVLNVDREAGAPIVSIKLHDDQPTIRVGDQLLLLEKSPRATNRLAFDAFSLADGKPQPFEVALPPHGVELELVPDAGSVVAVRSRLLERQIITNKLSTGPRVMTAAGVEKSVDQTFDKVLNENLTAGNSLNATLELVEQLNRRDAAAEPDETYEDRSRYEVELRRVHGGNSTWQGEVLGRPLYFPLPTVDVVAGGTRFQVIDKTGRLRWAAPLSFPLSERAVESARFHHPIFERFDRTQHDSQHGLRYRFPFVEAEGRLYAFDEGVLAAFDLQTGEVQWRVTSVGIRRIRFDHEGMLYVGTTLEGPDALGKPASTRKEAPTDALMKIDPATGKILWTVPYQGTELFVADPFLYSLWVAETALDRATALGANSDVVPTCIIARIDPGSGEVLWQRSYKGDPDTVDVQGTRVLIQFPRRIELLKFFSL